MQLGQLQKIEGELKALGYTLMAVSPDRPEKLKESVGKHELTYQLAADSRMDAAKAFGIAFKVDDSSYQRFLGFGINLEDASGERHHLLPVPAVFVAGTDGRINFQYVNPNYKVRLDPSILLAAARAGVKK